MSNGKSQRYFDKCSSPGYFRKCGISTFSRDAITDDPLKSPDMQNTESSGTVTAELKVDLMYQPEVPDVAEALVESTTHVYPPRLAIEAIESYLTPRKMTAYKRKEAKGESGANDLGCHLDVLDELSRGEAANNTPPQAMNMKSILS